MDTIIRPSRQASCRPVTYRALSSSHLTGTAGSRMAKTRRAAYKNK